MSGISGIPEGYGGIDLKAIDSTTPYVNAMLAQGRLDRANRQPEYAPKLATSKSLLFGDKHSLYVQGEDPIGLGNTYMQESGNNSKAAARRLESVVSNAFTADKNAEYHWGKAKEMMMKDEGKYATMENLEAINRFEDFASTMSKWTIARDGGVMYGYSEEDLSHLAEKYPDDPVFKKVKQDPNTGLYLIPAQDVRFSANFEMQAKIDPVTSATALASRLENDVVAEKRDLLNQDGTTKEFYTMTTKDKKNVFVPKDRFDLSVANDLFHGARFVDDVKDGRVDVTPADLADIKLSPQGLGVYEAHIAENFGNKPFSRLTIEEKSLAAEMIFQQHLEHTKSLKGVQSFDTKTVKGSVSSDNDYKDEQKANPAQQTGVPTIQDATIVQLRVIGGDKNKFVEKNVTGSMQFKNGIIVNLNTVNTSYKGNVEFSDIYALEDGTYAGTITIQQDLGANVVQGENVGGATSTDAENKNPINQLAKQTLITQIDAKVLGQIAEGLSNQGAWFEHNGEKIKITNVETLERFLLSQKKGEMAKDYK